MWGYKLGIMGGGGHIGLVHAACLAFLGYRVAAYDLDTAKIKSLKQGIIPLYEPGLEKLVHEGIKTGLLGFTNHINSLRDVDIAYICVGTPALPDGLADISQVENALEELVQVNKGPFIAVIKCTVPVGTNRKLSRRIKDIGLSHKISIVSNPEFLAEGTGIEDFLKPSRIVVGGVDREAVAKVAAIHTPPSAPVIHTGWENAELIKHASNAFLATKISFINEIASLSEAQEGDITIISKGIGLDPRIGPYFLEAGVGFSGPCLEKDLLSLINQYNAAGEEAPILKATLYVNNQRRRQIVKNLEKALGNLNGKNVGVLGLAFKPGTDDLRDSHSIPVIRHLLSLGTVVTVHDPMAANEAKKAWLMRQFPGILWASSPYFAAEGKDALLILTAWPEYQEMDLDILKQKLARPILVDGRNLFKRVQMEEQGFEYIGMGI